MLKVSFGQVSPDTLILTKVQSDAWISRLELALIDAQIDPTRWQFTGQELFGGVIILSARNRKVCKKFERINLE